LIKSTSSTYFPLYCVAIVSIPLGLKSGVSELGPLISSALGPLALLSAAVSAVKFFVSAMFAVDKQTVSLGRNLQISNESATQLRKYFLESSQSSKDLAYTTEDMVEAQMQLSQLSATSNLYSQDQLKAQIEGTKYLKLSVEEVSSLNKFSIAYGKNNKDIYDSASATVTQYQ
jgi:hypothetical protein